VAGAGLSGSGEGVLVWEWGQPGLMGPKDDKVPAFGIVLEGMLSSEAVSAYKLEFVTGWVVEV